MLQKMSKVFAAARMKDLCPYEMPTGNKITVLLDDRRNRPEVNVEHQRCMTETLDSPHRLHHDYSR